MRALLPICLAALLAAPALADDGVDAKLDEILDILGGFEHRLDRLDTRQAQEIRLKIYRFLARDDQWLPRYNINTDNMLIPQPTSLRLHS